MFRSRSVGSGSLSDVTITSSVKVTELCEPTGDVMNPTQGRLMFRRVWDVHNKYKLELVVNYSVVDEGNENGLYGDTEISPAPHGAS